MQLTNELVVISGYSGAGKTSAARILEDLGFFVIDNLPPQFLDSLIELALQNDSVLKRLALVIDAREASFLHIFLQKWQKLNNCQKKLLFIKASDTIIINRYQESKRLHPLDDGCGVINALAKEISLLKNIEDLADKIITTDNLSINQLKEEITNSLNIKSLELSTKIMSFGFKKGLPLNLDLCFDVRFLKNPYYHPALKNKTGLDKEVIGFIMQQENAKIMLDKITDMINFLYPLYEKEGKSSLTIAIGCTGGQHRSVCLAQNLYDKLKNSINNLKIEHRDLPLNH